jgi:hypothetical protein
MSGRFQGRRHKQRKQRMLCRFPIAVFLLILMMSFVSALMKGNKNTARCQATSSSASCISTASEQEQALRRGLWSFFAGDALAAPTHWFYGGFGQVQQYYGPLGIVDYTKPVEKLAGSIMNKSDLNGGGRASSSSKQKEQTIIGQVINHGKADLWSPSKQIHYHATLKAGENTLEASLARVLMKSMVQNDGYFVADHFRQAYIDFMMKPGSHNDAYARYEYSLFFLWNAFTHHSYSI